MLLLPDCSESLLSQQRQTDKDLFHTKPQLVGVISLKLSHIPHQLPRSRLVWKAAIPEVSENHSTVSFCVVYKEPG